MPRKTESNEVTWERRRGMFEEWCAGTPNHILAQKYKVHHDTVRDDINRVIAFLKNYDGLERISASRERMLAQLWREVELATECEQKCLDGIPAEDLTKDGQVVKIKIVDCRAATAYQGNRIKALTLIERLMGLHKAAPDPNSEKVATTWADVIKKAHERKAALAEQAAKAALPPGS